MSEIRTEASKAQLQYATLLHYGSILGFVVMVVTFLMYVMNMSIAPPHIPVAELVKTWHLSSAEFNAMHEVPKGWGWASLLLKGDFANFLGIAILAGLTIVCYVQLAYNFMKEKENLMTIIATAEVIILTIAASGIIDVGH